MSNITVEVSAAETQVVEVSPPRGYSAYEIAVQQGYEGTESEWLELTQGFYRVWLGRQAADPSVDIYGDPIQAGALYFNTTNGAYREFDGSVWDYLTPQGDYLLV